MKIGSLLISLLPLSLGSPVFSLPFGEVPFGSELRVLQLSADEFVTVPETEKLFLRRRGTNFFDITSHSGQIAGGKLKDEIPVPDYLYPTELNEIETVSKVNKMINTNSMQANLAEITSFYTRYYKSQSGFEASEWVSSKIIESTEKLPKEIVSVKHFDHKEWAQYSIIVQIKGYENPDNVVVIGSHLDSINLLLPSILPAPGADDNGSGTTTNLEALRLIVEHILSSGKTFRNTVEFHFYSAEEGGLLGSQDVYGEYRAQNKSVMAMLQQDMTGYVRDPSNEHIGVVTDYTTPALTSFMKLAIDNYLDIPYVETTCGYACSDHGSALKNGYPASFVIESDFKKTSKFIHSTLDTMDRLSLSHMAEHVKLVIGTVFELGNWPYFTKI
ncbi:putative aminopeptidase KNAG_0C04420 [Huiozyma naganishii CBS 8797]|uniref:Peptide hydrolase n=1 Tax=Huiozyma naganishii (strain ATCC MYA-139 / BCRC 22969 / CBS 8797 / KCTC 17520 / NBRC 10181 / NCYC 3082 / Yp74L-3) TaxID=1071383 RepID=J7S4Y5_HUIN7|nr:hypothetical protein KNAG_0C04420 [Kazachstania naganishii CBS 8797]CCK69544.1 hypothetical protein KNAG_0C04420 [Kazachstania naganishii CBS 8797]